MISSDPTFTCRALAPPHRSPSCSAPVLAAHAQEIKKGGTLVIGSTQAPRHLNGAVQSGLATALPSTQLFASPLRFDDKWNPQPYLAEKWTLAPMASR